MKELNDNEVNKIIADYMGLETIFDDGKWCEYNENQNPVIIKYWEANGKGVSECCILYSDNSSLEILIQDFDPEYVEKITGVKPILVKPIDITSDQTGSLNLKDL